MYLIFRAKNDIVDSSGVVTVLGYLYSILLITWSVTYECDASTIFFQSRIPALFHSHVIVALPPLNSILTRIFQNSALSRDL